MWSSQSLPPPPPCRTNVFLFLKNYLEQQWWQNTKNTWSFLSMHLVISLWFFSSLALTSCSAQLWIALISYRNPHLHEANNTYATSFSCHAWDTQVQPHSDFIYRLQDYMPSREASANYIVKSFKQQFCLQDISLDEVENTQLSLVLHITSIQVFTTGDL
jgi:hypothetical protein